MNKELIDRFREMSDEDLVDVLANEADYLPEAINYAKEELKRRKLSQFTTEKLFGERATARQIKIEKANEGLTLREKLICILLSLGVFIPFIKFLNRYRPSMITYREMGYIRKSSQVLTYTFIGIFFWIVVFVIFLVPH